MSNADTHAVRWADASLWNEPHQTLSLGCGVCPDLQLCGGLRRAAHQIDCTDHCCGDPQSCGRVCSKNLDAFVDFKRLVNGFELDDVPHAPSLDFPGLPYVVPLIYGAAGRQQALETDEVAIPLFKLVNSKDGKVRFESKEHLCAHFKVSPDAVVIASGVASDASLTGWWLLPERERSIQQLKAIGVAAVTSPNFTLANDVPRWDNLYAMKQIALAWSEFQRNGISAALHVNATSVRDYERWTEFIGSRPEVGAIAVEFATGAGRQGRIETHVSWLCDLANAVDRPLAVVVRGGFRIGGELLRQLVKHYARVLFLDSEPYHRTQKRKRAEVASSGSIRWRSTPTLPGISLEELLVHNIKTRDQVLRRDLGSGTARRARQGRKARYGNEKTLEMSALRETKLPKGW